MKSILLLLIGALLSGGIQTALGVFDRRREAETILTAIAAEVDALCRLITIQGYKETFDEMSQNIAAGTWDGATAVIEIRQNYFAVFESLTAKIGLLKPKHAHAIVHFYAYCKSAIDSTRPDGLMAGGVSSAERISQIIHLSHVFDAILQLGKAIVSMPKAKFAAADLLQAGE